MLRIHPRTSIDGEEKVKVHTYRNLLDVSDSDLNIDMFTVLPPYPSSVMNENGCGREEKGGQKEPASGFLACCQN
ncbi:hypothetical protein TNCT_95531 [Trichonephila clavata]|uniref:Uncharacterized protein n=1 Tax=Trichonephila clavata TaxID=2740835 RepID=A0A8X6LMK2_TRICU|nr:hypothetical protein TNCT_95531 [Trichonephila clavata]